MRGLGLIACQPRPWRHSLTESNPSGPIPDRVARDFTADAPGTKMVGDITYIPTWQGWLYLATVIDCHTKAVIGWAMGDNYKTPLISSAIDMAVRNHAIQRKAIFHSDRGSNYTSEEFAQVLAGHDLLQSVGRTGICYDCEHRDCATTWGLTLAYDRPCGCPRVDVSAPGGGVHQAAGRVGSDLIGA